MTYSIYRYAAILLLTMFVLLLPRLTKPNEFGRVAQNPNDGRGVVRRSFWAVNSSGFLDQSNSQGS
jgi:hypothetical protein